jgi:hypothetical protein
MHHLRSYKKLRAALALEHYSALTPRNGKYGADQLARRREFEARLLAVTPTHSVDDASACLSR